LGLGRNIRRYRTPQQVQNAVGLDASLFASPSISALWQAEVEDRLTAEDPVGAAWWPTATSRAPSSTGRQFTRDSSTDSAGLRPEPSETSSGAYAEGERGAAYSLPSSIRSW
jgi:hypothetical protein